MSVNSKSVPSLLLTRRQTARGLGRNAQDASAHVLLVVEDDKLSSTLHEALAHVAITLWHVHSIEEAVQQLAQREFALLLVQDPLGDMEGIEVAEAIFTQTHARPVPVLLLTNDGSQEAALLSAAPCLVDYAPRSLPPGAIAAKVQVFVRLHQLNLQLAWEIEERQHIDEQLKATEAQLRGLATRLLTLKDEEQFRIAREIHDTLGQALAALKLDLLWIAKRLPDDQSLQDKAHAMAGLIEESVLSLREIVTRLRPDILEQMGLVPALAHVVRDFESHSGIISDFQGAVGREEPDWERATALLRVCQELLTNVARHAEASHVEVRLHAERDRLVLDVNDDGKGIAPADLHKPASLGLIGMRERIAPFDGHLKIESTGGGTHVSVSIPLDLSAFRADAASA